MPMAWPRMAWRGVALGAEGLKKKRNAVGPSEGNTNGVRESAATAPSSPMVTNPFTSMNAAQTTRSSNRPSRWVSRSRRTSPRVTSGAKTAMRARPGSAIALTPPQPPVEVDDVLEQPGVEQEERERGDRRRQEDVRHGGARGLQRRRQQPQLDDHQHADEEADPGEERQALAARL